MSLETDLLLDRHRLKRRLVFWRSFAVLAVVAAILVGLHGSGIWFHQAHVARLSVNGLITEDRNVTRALDKLATDSSVKALILSIDSPGGSVAGGESLHDAIARVAARKPVVAVMRGVAASAGYMIAVAANRIYARQATLTGSIGVLLQAPQVSGLLDKLGIGVTTIVSGPLKDQPSLTHPLSEQGKTVLQALVMDMYDQFVAMVATGRHMDPAKVRELGDGRAYTGRAGAEARPDRRDRRRAGGAAWLASSQGRAGRPAGAGHRHPAASPSGNCPACWGRCSKGFGKACFPKALRLTVAGPSGIVSAVEMFQPAGTGQGTAT